MERSTTHGQFQTSSTDVAIIPSALVPKKQGSRAGIDVPSDDVIDDAFSPRFIFGVSREKPGNGSRRDSHVAGIREGCEGGRADRGVLILIVHVVRCYKAISRLRANVLSTPHPSMKRSKDVAVSLPEMVVHPNAAIVSK
ncbi:hypothetical protein DOTSEDRAFT_30665 [Dothistroma septosporum NZE10]|uniref:Uncharacterized protein n=1 Tax=Dothistroma septosporum (strain NZE10 / CBS 128990) TaxID=675120 RepID=N1Q4A9_DOTSN|nr:hypothetical protein DOTSEDRAFT_30665 [Dothistroma septosporum NZE10]